MSEAINSNEDLSLISAPYEAKSEGGSIEEVISGKNERSYSRTFTEVESEQMREVREKLMQ